LSLAPPPPAVGATPGVGASIASTLSAKRIMIVPTMPNHHHKEPASSPIETTKSHLQTEGMDSSSKDRIVEEEQDKIASFVLEQEQDIPAPPLLPSPADIAEQKKHEHLHEPEFKEHVFTKNKSLVKTSNTVEENEEEEMKEKNQEPSPSTITEANTANLEHKEENEKIEEESSEDTDSPPGKLPLRTAEAEAALDRIRAIQQRRQNLYNRAIARQENKLKPLSTISSSPLASEMPGLARTPAPAPAPRPSQASPSIPVSGEAPLPLTTPLPSGSRYESEREIEQHIEDEDGNNSHDNIEALDIPKGMSLAELRERAMAANKAAAASATAAHRAASASALAADAADTAIHAAQQASLAATQCQNALDLRSADAIEEAFNAATAAEEKAEAAARQAAVGAAKAVVSKRDAEKKGEIALKAAELSRPHGIGAQSSAFWRQLRRDTGTAAEKTQENVEAGVAAAGWMWNQGSEKVQHAGKGAIDSVQSAWKAVQERIHVGKANAAQLDNIKKAGGMGGGVKEEEESTRRGWFGRSKVKK
jgi:hypothetical protein